MNYSNTYKQTNFSNLLKNQIIYEVFTYKWYMYIHLTVCKQMIDV